jgi:hypothetical protein
MAVLSAARVEVEEGVVTQSCYLVRIAAARWRIKGESLWRQEEKDGGESECEREAE